MAHLATFTIVLAEPAIKIGLLVTWLSQLIRVSTEDSLYYEYIIFYFLVVIPFPAGMNTIVQVN